MIQSPLILLHEESLRMAHPVFKKAPEDTRVIYVWDDAYVQATAYRLKRLIFIYETLCELDLDILHGDTLTILQEINPSIVFIPSTNNPLLLKNIHSIGKILPIEVVEDEPFVLLKTTECQRFSQYWRKAEKTAFLHHGGVNA